jgi:hypothetical protein
MVHCVAPLWSAAVSKRAHVPDLTPVKSPPCKMRL